MKFGNIELIGRIFGLKLELIEDTDQINLDELGRLYYNDSTQSVEVVTDDGIKSLQFGYDSDNKLIETLGSNWINPDYSFNPVPFNELQNIAGLSSTDSLFDVITHLDSVIGNRASTNITMTQDRYLLNTDNFLRLRLSTSTPRNLVIRNNSNIAYKDNFEVEIEQTGTAVINITAESGVTLNYNSVYNAATSARYSVVKIKRVGINEWTLSGDLEII
jgi:hypothetical protein